MINKMLNDKRGIENVIGYILLIAIVIALSVLVYGWLKTYVPSESIECSDGTSISVDNYVYDCTNNVLNLTLKNSGRFNIAGFYINGRTTAVEGLATTDLSPYTSLGSEGVVVFDAAANIIDTNTLISSSFAFNTTEFITIYSIDLVPTRYQTFNGKNILVNCGNAKISEDLKCMGNATAVCGNNIQETGETCDGTDLNGQTCVTQGFDGGTLSCSANCQSFVTSQCTVTTCGNGVIDSGLGETCDDSNTNSSDGCSSVCQVEFGYTCSGAPSVCTGLGIFNATYSNLSKDTGSNPDPSNCHVSQGCHWWYYNINLQELGNLTGITVTSTQKCFDFATLTDSCNPVVGSSGIITAFGTDYIFPGSSITANNSYVYTTDSLMTVTATFNGTDDNSHFVTTNYTFTVTN